MAKNKSKKTKKEEKILISYKRATGTGRNFVEIPVSSLSVFASNYKNLLIHEVDKGRKFEIKTEIVVEELR